MVYYSQSKQDEFVAQFLNFKTDGYFLDIGAHDGILSSNTLFFEKELGWSGICVEPNSEIFSELSMNRYVKCLNLAISDIDGFIKFDGFNCTDIGYDVPCMRFDTMLNKYNVPNTIDYMSIDIEGHEFIALKDFPFDNYIVRAMTIEHNLYANGSELKDSIYYLLSNNGYTRYRENALCLDKNPEWYLKPYEDWYVHTEFLEEIKLWTF